MAEERRSFTIKEDENGGVHITDEVQAGVAGQAAAEVEGVDSLSGNLTSDIISKVGINKLSKGVRTFAEEDGTVSVRLSLNMKYGYEIPKVCEAVQEKVKTTVENMTGLSVTGVDIRIAAVNVSNQ